MTEKLLYKTQKSYLIFSVIVFLIVAPLFYFVTQKLYLHEADEYLELQKHQFVQKSLSELNKSDIFLWNKYNIDLKIIAGKKIPKDTLFFISYFDAIEQENEPYRELNAPIVIENQDYIFSARVNLVETQDLILNLALLFILILITLLLGFIFINKKLSISLWKPFYHTLSQIEAFEIDKKEFPNLPQSKIEEFERLNKSIHKLIRKNTLIYQNQREFVENAAHELQTPIAIFKVKIDTLIQDENLTEKQASILIAIHEILNRLTRLNKNLLLLSKIENTENYHKNTFSINELLQKKLVFFEEQAAQKNIELNLKITEEILISANSDLTEIVLNNLLMNAIRHNKTDGKIDIRLSNNTLEISNTGIDKALAKEQIFNRFSKIDASKQGNGLGLAIVKKIIELNQWKISYVFEDNLHTFLIKF